jgi:lysophospholipase L1-like esterase
MPLRFAILAAGLFAALTLQAGELPKLEPAPRNDKPDWMPKHNALVAQAKKGPCDLYFLGDSITEYWNDAGKDVWAKNYAPLKAGNFGIAADKVEHILWRVKNGEFEGLKPKVAVLLGGINNTWAVKREEREAKGVQIAACLGEIVKTIQEKSPETKVIVLAVLPTADGRDTVVNAINASLAKLDNGKNVRYLDLAPKLAPTGKAEKDLFPDGLHPGPKGYELWAEAMAPLLKELLGK